MNPLQKAEAIAQEAIHKAYWLGVEVGQMAEREECAKVAETKGVQMAAPAELERHLVQQWKDIAAAIRARGSKDNEGGET